MTQHVCSSVSCSSSVFGGGGGAGSAPELRVCTEEQESADEPFSCSVQGAVQRRPDVNDGEGGGQSGNVGHISAGCTSSLRAHVSVKGLSRVAKQRQK